MSRFAFSDFLSADLQGMAIPQAWLYRCTACDQITIWSSWAIPRLPYGEAVAVQLSALQGHEVHTSDCLLLPVEDDKFS
jgi:hypothetical protein